MALQRYIESEVERALRSFSEGEPRPLDIADVECDITEDVASQEWEVRFIIGFRDCPETCSVAFSIPRLIVAATFSNETRSLRLEPIIRSIWARIRDDREFAHRLEQQRIAIDALEAAGVAPEVVAVARQAFERDQEHARRHHNYELEQARLLDPLLEYQRTLAQQQAVIQQQQSLYFNSLANSDPYQQQRQAALQNMYSYGLGGDEGGLGLGGGGYATAYIRPIDSEAEKKGLKLLKENLTPEQLECYEKNQYFDTVGESSGKTYRIKRGTQMNVYELDKDGNEVCGWCFVTQDYLCVSDTMLCQKVALETDEKAAMKVANRFADYRNPLRRGGLRGFAGLLLGTN